jgi:hypothetical protein
MADSSFGSVLLERCLSPNYRTPVLGFILGGSEICTAFREQLIVSVSICADKWNTLSECTRDSGFGGRKCPNSVDKIGAAGVPSTPRYTGCFLRKSDEALRSG